MDRKYPRAGPLAVTALLATAAAVPAQTVRSGAGTGPTDARATRAAATAGSPSAKVRRMARPTTATSMALRRPTFRYTSQPVRSASTGVGSSGVSPS